MVYYYTTFNIVRVKNAADGKEVFVPFIGSNTGGNMKECRNSDNKIICFETTTNGFSYITSLGWELWWHDDHYNAIQRWVIRKKIPKQELQKYMEEDMILTDSIERIPSAVEELQEDGKIILCSQTTHKVPGKAGTFFIYLKSQYHYHQR